MQNVVWHYLSVPKNTLFDEFYLWNAFDRWSRLFYNCQITTTVQIPPPTANHFFLDKCTHENDWMYLREINSLLSLAILFGLLMPSSQINRLTYLRITVAKFIFFSNLWSCIPSNLPERLSLTMCEMAYQHLSDDRKPLSQTLKGTLSWLRLAE